MGEVNRNIRISSIFCFFLFTFIPLSERLYAFMLIFDRHCPVQVLQDNDLVKWHKKTKIGISVEEEKMPKVDYKKDYKDFYLPKTTPAIIDVPSMAFIMVNGKGDPKREEYQDALSLLYSLSYTIKMKGKDIAGYLDYTVFPLESFWWCEDGTFDYDNRDIWCFTSLIRQPEFVTAEVFEWAIEHTKKKKPALDFSKARFEHFYEGLCVQVMHIGPYEDEPATIEKIHAFMVENELVNMTGIERKHHEIYLSNPNKTKPEKMKTVIRLPVSKK